MTLKRKKLYSSLIILFLLFNNYSIAFANPTSSNNQIISESLEKYSELDDETLKINSEISSLSEKIEELNLDLKEKDAEISDAEIQIETTNKKIEETENEISEKEDIMEDRIRAMYKTDLTTSFISYIISSENIYELFSRATSITKIISADRKIILEINEKKENLIADKTLVENKKKELLTLKASIESNLKEINSKKLEQESLLNELENRKLELMDIIEENEISLISNSLNIIDSESSSMEELTNALYNLSYILPQLNSSSAIESTNNAIKSANSKIDALKTKLEASKLQETANKDSATIESSNNIETSKSTYSMVATAYTGGTLTAMGLKPIRDPNGISTVAVDPSVIPLGSKLYVKGYGYAIASDTGGAIKGNKIDIYLNSVSECISFGRQTVSVTVLAYPGEW